jgi:hypothetical protein
MGAKPVDALFPPMRGKSAKGTRASLKGCFLGCGHPNKEKSNQQTSARNFYLCHDFEISISIFNFAPLSKSLFFPTSSQSKPSTAKKVFSLPLGPQEQTACAKFRRAPITLARCSFPIARSQIHNINRNGRSKRFSRPWRRR